MRLCPIKLYIFTVFTPSVNFSNLTFKTLSTGLGNTFAN